MELADEGYPLGLPTAQIPIKTAYHNLQFMDVGVLWKNSLPVFIEFDDFSHLDPMVQVRDGFKTAWATEHGYPLIRVTYYNTTIKQIKKAILNTMAVRCLLDEEPKTAMATA